MAHRFETRTDLDAAVGQTLGPSDWLTIDQQRIDLFAEATDDRQWIHVDPARAAAGPYGSTVAHGYLTLSLLPALVDDVLDYAGWPAKLNYGSDKVRFPAPVPVGSRLRASVEVAAVRDVPAGIQVVNRVTVEIDGSDRPALVAETITLLLH
jgi:acyl dehydratase